MIDKLTGKVSVICVKSIIPSFTEGKIYNGEWSNYVVTSAPQLRVTDDTGFMGHIILEGNDDEWFNTHFRRI